jgi:hypothetical protein
MVCRAGRAASLTGAVSRIMDFSARRDPSENRACLRIIAEITLLSAYTCS